MVCIGCCTFFLYVQRLARHYRIAALLNVVATIIVFSHWQMGLGLSAGLAAWLIIPPATRRYITEAPIIGGES